MMERGDGVTRVVEKTEVHTKKSKRGNSRYEERGGRRDAGTRGRSIEEGSHRRL